MKRTTARALTIATSLAVAGAVAGAGALSAGVSAAPTTQAVAYRAVSAKFVDASLSTAHGVDRATFAQRASRDAARRASHLRAMRAARKKAHLKQLLTVRDASVVRHLDIPAAHGGSTRSIGRAMAARRGWTGRQWAALDSLWSAESGWRIGAGNGYGAYGIPQALPGSKMAGAGGDWRTSARTQIAWGLSYIAGRWGSPEAAWSHFNACRWY